MIERLKARNELILDLYAEGRWTAKEIARAISEIAPDVTPRTVQAIRDRARQAGDPRVFVERQARRFTDAPAKRTVDYWNQKGIEA